MEELGTGERAARMDPAPDFTPRCAAAQILRRLDARATPMSRVF